MAATLAKGTGALGLANGDASTSHISVSFPLPRAPQTAIHLQLHDNGTNILLFLATCTPESSNAASLGSFVYAMPNRTNPSESLSTPLFTPPSTLDFTTRMAKVLARKLKKPVYVGNSMSFASAGMGGTIAEEIEGFRRVIEVVMQLVDRDKDAPW